MEGISKYRIPRSRLTNKNKRNTVPSTNVRNYEPGLNETAVLMAPGFNYKEAAKNKMANTQTKYNWSVFTSKMANLTGRRNNMRKNNTKNNTRKVNNSKNNTRRTLF
jgi:hypothetical protein